jgi:soluble lytic murein transglycosylase
MGSASAVAVGGPEFQGSPITLGVLCLLAAAAGAAVGAIAGSSAEQRASEQHETTSIAAHAAALRVEHRHEEALKATLQERDEQLEALGRVGVLQEAKDLEEAEKLGLPEALQPDLARLTGDDGRRVLAALAREGRRNGLDPVLLAAVIRVETHFDPYAMSSVGARGLMQLMPATAIDMAHRRGFRVSAKQLFNPVVNIELGSAYLKELIDRFGDVRSALIAYNAGPTIARHRHISPSVRAYPRNVLAEYQRLAWLARKAEAGGAAAVATSQ